MGKPRIVITPGDPAGIGPEITIKSLMKQRFFELASICVVCHSEVLEKAADTIGCSISFNTVKTLDEMTNELNTINVIEPKISTPLPVNFGKVNPDCGLVSYEYIRTAVGLIMRGDFDALVTGPINKEALKAAGIKQLDHASILRELTGVARVGVMFEVDRLRIFFLTRHLSLLDAIRYISLENVYEGIIETIDFLKMLGESNPVLGVAALNPHGGEGGMFGNEEIKYIKPAVVRALKEGYDVRGPLPADSIFYRALHGDFSAVLSLYHDQGHIAAKTYDFERTVSITVGLPFIRTSVDHGTAFDIAGKGVASPTGMEQAILAAIRYATIYQKTG